MQWTSEAIILKQEQFSDDKLLCQMFSSMHGLYKGLITINKRTRNQIQIGNIVQSTWKARLEEHLGSFYCELIKPLSMSILNDKLKLTSVLSLCSLLSTCLPARTIEPRIYDSFLSYLLSLKDHHGWLLDYLRLELLLLQELGYGLNLSYCAVTGAKNDLYYISPKSGNAVSKEAGKDYHKKLFLLPQFMINDANTAEIPGRAASRLAGDDGLGGHLAVRLGINREDILNGLKISGYFIEQRIYKAHSQEIPGIRNNFLSMVSET